MKNALKVTFGTMLAVSMVAPNIAAAHEHFNTNHFAVWGDATYTKPSNNGLSVGDQLFANVGGNSGGAGAFDGGRRHVFIQPDMEFDYALGISYRMPHTHTRLFFSYDHYDNDVDDQGDVDIRNLGIFPPAATQGIAQYDVHSHEFRLGAVHDLHFGDRFCLDLLAFFEYDKVRQTLNESIFQTGTVRARETEGKIQGFGPGVGFMTRWYAHSPHWHVFAGANTTLIAGENHYSQTFFEDSGNFYIYEPDESDSIVGKIDINFGLNYRCAFRHEMHGMVWDVSLGMRYMNMFNAFKNGNTAFNPNAGVNNTVVADFAPNLGMPQDWGRYGPFLRFKIGGAHS